MKQSSRKHICFNTRFCSHHIQSLYIFQKVLDECTCTFQYNIWKYLQFRNLHILKIDSFCKEKTILI